MSSDAAAATAEGGGGRSKINEVWHVRHGQKCNEVQGAERQAWVQSPRFMRVGYFDTFLTRHGHVQASRAGLYLKSLPFNQRVGGFDVVYTSPLVRAVQTAVCVSQGLGNLPLQVVPGLSSCTAALVRIGRTAQDNLMSDEEIRETFSWITVIPRDPQAPATFPGAAAWLAAKADEKGGTREDDGDGGWLCVSRILTVGHQEGIKAMAGAKVPTPHCCIGVFRTEALEETSGYRLYDLLSHKGKSINPSRESSQYARPMTVPTGEEDSPPKDGGGDLDSSDEDGNGSEESAVAAQVIALTVSADAGAQTPVV